ncbi:hypothetical protein E5K99_05455 [Helicobacter pylori]|nr:hypothetical protein E5K99_05455 [Helicobacter pylori]
MRQKNETVTSFNQLKEITQIMQVLERRTQTTSANANTSEITSQSTLTPKAKERAKNHALKPTKRAFSERQRTAFRDKSQASTNKSQGSKQANHPNAFKSDEAFKQGLATQQNRVTK